MAINKIDELLNIMEHLLAKGSKVPFSGGKALVYANEGLEILEEIRMNIPNEIRQAKDIIAREEKIIEDAKVSANLILKNAEEKACLLISEEEITKKAHSKAQDVVNEAIMNARGVKLNTYKYLDELLSKTENGLISCLNGVKNTKSVLKNNSNSELSFNIR